MGKETVRDFYGKILGSLEDLPNGDRVARDFYGNVLGYYRKATNVTTDFFGRTLYQGDHVAGLIH